MALSVCIMTMNKPRAIFLLLILGCLLSVSSSYTTALSIKSSLWRRPKSRQLTPHSICNVDERPTSSLTRLRAGGSDLDNTAGKFKKELIAEFIGTFIIVQLGTGAVMSDIFGGALSGLFQIASVWIIAVTLAISTTSSISGAHLNPSISVALALVRDFEWAKVIPYSIAQTLGALAASAVNLVLFAGKIQAFELAHGISRGTTASIASARAFGEYFA